MLINCGYGGFMIVHCNMKLRPNEIWFLVDNDTFTNRRLELGVCPVCDHNVVRLVETRIEDNKVFETTTQRRKANRLMNSLKSEISYSSLDSRITNKSLFGWRYGESKEVRKKDGTIVVTQKAVDFYGNKEIVKQEIK